MRDVQAIDGLHRKALAGQTEGLGRGGSSEWLQPRIQFGAAALHWPRKRCSYLPACRCRATHQTRGRTIAGKPCAPIQASANGNVVTNAAAVRVAAASLNQHHMASSAAVEDVQTVAGQTRDLRQGQRAIGQQ
jgi:hypothetical protein